MRAQFSNSIATTILAVTIAIGTVLIQHVVNPARADDIVVDPDRRPLTLAEMQRLEETGPALTKQFIATLRKRYDADTAAELRSFIDPRYLKRHGLETGAFPIRTVLTKDIHDNQATDDPQTLVIVAQTEVAEKEAFVFRITVLEGKVYLQPLAPPDPQTKGFAPWILRMKL